VERGKDYGFARDLSSIPLLSSEFAFALHEYPIVFSKAGDDYIPAALSGLKEQQNLFVDAKKKWTGNYIPAFIRRYPFIFVPAKQNPDKQLLLCIDEAYTGCNMTGKGDSLFRPDGEQTEYLKQALNFVATYQQALQETNAFCKTLKSLDLIAPLNLTLTSPQGQKVALAGLHAVRRDKLHALAPEKLSELIKSGVLEMIYAHLLSLGNLSTLARRL
jgi:hypothetical protein